MEKRCYVIGRESDDGAGRLKIVSRNWSLGNDNTTEHTIVLGEPWSVPQSVSRKHCELQVDSENDTMVLVNLNFRNKTWLNDLEIASAEVSANDRIELGQDRYQLPLDELLTVIKAEKPKTFDLAELQGVWNAFQQKRMKQSERKVKQDIMQSLGGVLSMGATAGGVIWHSSAISLLLCVLAFVVGLFIFIISFKDAGKHLKEKQKLDEWFRQSYVCPNPQCGKSLTDHAIYDLERDGECPYCRCRLTETTTIPPVNQCK